MSMEYTIVVKTSVGDLANAVDQQLKSGWKPVGGICAVEEQNNPGPGSHLAIHAGNDSRFLGRCGHHVEWRRVCICLHAARWKLRSD